MRGSTENMENFLTWKLTLDSASSFGQKRVNSQAAILSTPVPIYFTGDQLHYKKYMHGSSV